ncbi:MAG: hypothetical protein M3552_07195 [Planctomycetota bacterium]|nr:hypothetical protein [Planctomycetaceae bacterium]MDQ3330422.1 hypothetical protein [Planctomycetota bacterium]
MARRESDREDLFAEATALVRRAELAGLGFSEPIVAGFKRDGSLSVYLGRDPVYHFDASYRLKRAFRRGRLYRTQGETLAELSRERTDIATVLRRRDLPPTECEAVLSEMRQLLQALWAQIDRGKSKVLRQFPADDKALVDGALVSALQIASGVMEEPISLAPRFKGKR